MPRFHFSEPDPAVPVSIYRVLMVSSNTNSFGYRQVVLIASDGRAAVALWNIGRAEPVPERGQPCTLSDDTRDEYHTVYGSRWSFEMVHAVEDAPPSAVARAWQGVTR